MLETIDLSKSLTKEEYTRDLVRYQLMLRELALQLYEQKRTLVVVYEGWDAGGKGGMIQACWNSLEYPELIFMARNPATVTYRRFSFEWTATVPGHFFQERLP